MYPSSLLLYFFPSLCHYFFFLSLLPSLLSFVFGYFSPSFLPSLVSLTSYPYTYPCSIGNLGRLSGVHVRGAMLTQHVHVSQSVVQLKQFHTCVRGFVNIDVLSCERGCLNAVFTGSSSHVWPQTFSWRPMVPFRRRRQRVEQCFVLMSAAVGRLTLIAYTSACQACNGFPGLEGTQVTN